DVDGGGRRDLPPGGGPRVDRRARVRGAPGTPDAAAAGELGGCGGPPAGAAGGPRPARVPVDSGRGAASLRHRPGAVRKPGAAPAPGGVVGAPMKDPRPPLLLVDDHPGVRRLIQVALRDLAAVDEAPDWSTAVALLEERDRKSVAEA